MISRVGLITAADLLAMKDDGYRYELVAGELRKMSPAGNEHGRITARIMLRLAAHVEQHDCGHTYAAETGFRIAQSPDTVRAPDAAFVSHRRLAGLEEAIGYLPLAPDLVVEVVSLNDRFSEVESKATNWLQAGSQVVLVADPRTRTLRVYRDAHSIEVLHEGETFDAGQAVNGWQLSISDLFSA